MQIFRSVQDSDVASAIASAKNRLVFVAPGISVPIGTALQEQLTAKRCTQFVIILDGDEECCRLGYCEASALESLNSVAQDSGLAIRKQTGLRVGLLMADEQVLIWTPTPLMFEAPRTPDEPNGLILTAETIENLPEALGAVRDGPSEEIEIGTALLQPTEIKRVVEAIKLAPPAPFDLSRLARVFSARFQFIETVLRGAELTKREMRLDSLIVNSDAPEELRPLLQTTIQPFNTDADKTVEVPVIVNGEQAFSRTGEQLKQPTTQAEIHTYWSDLSNRFIINLPGYGKIIRHADKAKFEAGKRDFETVLTAWVDGFRDLVKGDHDKRVSRVVDLIEQRMARADQRQQLKREDIKMLVQKGLDNLRVIEPSVKVVYKNITVESTRDSEFLDVLRKAVPAKELEGWFQIFDAAPAVTLGGQRTF